MLGFLSFTWLGARGIYEPAVRCACSMLATLTHSPSCPGCFTHLQPSVVNNAMIDILAQTVSTSDVPTEMGVLGLGVCVYSASLRRDKTAPIYDSPGNGWCSPFILPITSTWYHLQNNLRYTPSPWVYQ